MDNEINETNVNKVIAQWSLKCVDCEKPLMDDGKCPSCSIKIDHTL